MSEENSILLGALARLRNELAFHQSLETDGDKEFAEDLETVLNFVEEQVK